MPIFPAQPPQKHPLSCTITPPESSLPTPEEGDHAVILWSGSPQPYDVCFCSPKSFNISKVPYMVQRLSEGAEWPVQNMDIWIQGEALKCTGNRSKSQENYLYGVWCGVWCAHTHKMIK